MDPPPKKEQHKPSPVTRRPCVRQTQPAPSPLEVLSVAASLLRLVGTVESLSYNLHFLFRAMYILSMLVYILYNDIFNLQNILSGFI